MVDSSADSLFIMLMEDTDIGDNLLARLADERTTAPRRPLAFVAHSLGGLLVKRVSDDLPLLSRILLTG